MSALPSEELFCSSGYAPQLSELNWQILPPIIRVLLTTDGTVTKSLESYFWEPVNVICQQQDRLAREVLDGTRNELAQQDGEVWRRRVLLQGANSHKGFVEASSLVCFALLPEPLRQGLLQGELGIGEIMRSLGMETYRRIIAIGQLPAHADHPERVWRKYDIYYQGRILMQIQEDFILNMFT